MGTPEKIAGALLDIKAVGFALENPITFKSGIKSPVYVDNRKFPYNPQEWKLVIKGFEELIGANKIIFDVIAGIESAGIPHSAALGFSLSKASVFVRKAVKDHGTKKMVEGGNVSDKAVMLIEDHVTTGGSSLAGVQSIRAEGGIVNTCLAITSYEFPESKAEFEDAGVTLYTLTTFSVILAEAKKRNLLTNDQVIIVQDWFSDPHGWAKRQGLE